MNLFFDDQVLDREIINQVIRPYRQRYTLSDLGFNKQDLIQLGQKTRCIDNVKINRQDFQIYNSQEQIIVASIWLPENSNQQTPIIIFNHGNSGSRMDSLQLIKYVLPQNFGLCSFDFSGCGISQGNIVTLGLKEQDDLNCIINHLKQNLKFSNFILWGRSMGAVVALLQGSKQQKEILGLVCDSPFSSFKKLAQDIAENKVGSTIANLFFEEVIESMCNKLQKATGQDFKKLETWKSAELCVVPAIFAYSFEDKLINANHSQTLFKHYKGLKNKVIFKGDHNAIRDSEFYSKILNYLQQIPKIQQLIQTQNVKQINKNMSHQRLLTQVNFKNENQQYIKNKDHFFHQQMQQNHTQNNKNQNLKQATGISLFGVTTSRIVNQNDKKIQNKDNDHYLKLNNNSCFINNSPYNNYSFNCNQSVNYNIIHKQISSKNLLQQPKQLGILLQTNKQIQF